MSADFQNEIEFKVYILLRLLLYSPPVQSFVKVSGKLSDIRFLQLQYVFKTTRVFQTVLISEKMLSLLQPHAWYVSRLYGYVQIKNTAQNGPLINLAFYVSAKNYINIYTALKILQPIYYIHHRILWSDINLKDLEITFQRISRRGSTKSVIEFLESLLNG